MAEAEDLPIAVMREYISEQRLMASTLYQSIFEKGEARGEAKGEAKFCAETILRVLSRWLGLVEPDLREHIRAVHDMDTLLPWYEEALFLDGAEAAGRLAAKIEKALAR